MCFLPAAPKAVMPTIQQPTAPPTQRDAKLDATAERQRRAKLDQGDATGGLGDPSLAPVTKSRLGS